MKIKNLLAVAALCLFSSTASAQCRDYNGIYFQYNPTFLINSDYAPYYYETGVANGLTMGYVRSIPISSKIPFFLEVGGNLEYGFITEKPWNNYKDIRFTTHKMSFNIPVNFGYSFGLGSERLALNPYVGVRMRFNFLGQGVMSNNSDSETINFFSSDDLNSDYTWNVFQVGLQAGVKFIINKHFMLEAGYSYDFIPLAKCVNTKTKTREEDYLYTMALNFGIGFCW
jgi:opacity protein-like surface antigen